MNRVRHALSSWAQRHLKCAISISLTVLLTLVLLVLLIGGAALAPASAQQSSPQMDPSFYSAMRWRSIGPLRAGRVAAVAGIPGEPATFYIGMPGGGIWKTTNAGEVWKPI